MSEAPTLLAEYVKRGSEKAFRELVARYTNLVYSTALRFVEGDAHSAEDIAQTVFLDLARKAGNLAADVSLGGWLHRHTCYVAATAMRGQRRRQARERTAVAMNTQEDHGASNLAAVAPVLDDAINQLNGDDRAAIVLRFFEQLDFRAIGAQLGSSDDAARMRVNRAVEKLHEMLKGQGVTLSAAGLGTALAAESVKAAPVGMAAALATHALTGAGPTAGVGLAKIAGVAKFKVVFGAVAAAALLAAPLVMQHQRLARAQADNQGLRAQADQLSALQAENARLTAAVESNRGGSLTEPQTHELARLRAEVGSLRGKTNQMADEIAFLRNQPLPPEFHHGKHVFRGVTMDQFARYLSEILDATVANETGLTGQYDMAWTPLRVGSGDFLVQHVASVLREELGLELAQKQRGAARVLGMGARRFDPPKTVTFTNYALRVSDSSAFGLKPASSDPDPFGLAQADAADNATGTQAAGGAGSAAGADIDDASARNACINNLRLIDSAKQQWALEKGASPTNVPTWDDIRPYMRPSGDGSDPACPAGGAYTIGAVSNAPTCSISGHSLQ
jgi:RNA polymerase sigma factor (sigma-70 family)